MPASGSGSAYSTIPTPGYDGIYPFVRNRMPDSLEGKPDSDLDGEIGAVVLRLFDRFPCLRDTYESYDFLSGDDKTRFDEAAGLIVAAKLLTPMSTGGANSDLVLEKTDTTTRQFAQINNSSAGEKDKWLMQATEAIGRVACIKAYFQNRAASFSPFKVAGPTRTAAQAGTRQTLLGAILSVLAPVPDDLAAL
jgi:hypothetical protein